MSRLERWKTGNPGTMALYVPVEDQESMAEATAKHYQISALYQNRAGKLLGKGYLVPSDAPILNKAVNLY